MESRGKIWLITGCSQGIGLGFVEHILMNYIEDLVLATCRCPSEASRLQELNVHHSRLLVLQLDISSPISQAKLRDQLLSLNISTIDVLVLNAVELGEQPWSGFFDVTTLPNLSGTYETNAKGGLLTLQTFGDQVLTSQCRLVVVITTVMSSMSKADKSSYLAYRVTKTALNMLAATFAADGKVKESGCKILCIHPGWVKTRLGGARATYTVQESVGNVMKIISVVCNRQLGAAHDDIHEMKFKELLDILGTNGCVFMSYDGSILPW